MNKKIIVSTIIFSLLFTGQAFAATTAQPTGANNQTLNNQINQLKDKIASRVSQLNLVEKRGIIGTIQDVNSSKVTLLDTKGENRYIDIDEITKFSSAAGSGITVSDLKKGMEISVLGIYNKESQRILARFVSVTSVPTRYNGEITSIDKQNYRITMMTDDQKSQNVDIESTTKVSSYTPDAGLTRYGFSKLSVGDRIEAIGYPDKKDASLLITDRLIDLLNAPKNPNISIVTPTSSPTIAPTSAGVKSIKPIK